MDSLTEQEPSKTLPFDNLFLNSGFVNGINKWYLFICTAAFTILCYLLAPSISSLHLLYTAYSKNLNLDELKSNPNLMFDADWLGVDKNYVLIALFGIFVVAALGLIFALKKFQHKNILNVITAYDKFRYKRFVFAFAIWAVAIAVSTIAEYLLYNQNYSFQFNAQGFIISIVLMVIFMPIQSGFEEVFFRGFLLQGFALIFENGWIPLILTSILFGLAHMSNPEVDEYGWPMMLSYYVLFALFMGVITLLDEGLELAIGIHLANNMMASMLVCSKHSVIKTYSILQEEKGNPMFEIIAWIICALLIFIIFKKKYNWKNYQLILK